jgi:hypothetical protein
LLQNKPSGRHKKNKKGIRKKKENVMKDLNQDTEEGREREREREVTGNVGNNKRFLLQV